jgi:hypothetical protein
MFDIRRCTNLFLAKRHSRPETVVSVSDVPVLGKWRECSQCRCRALYGRIVGTVESSWNVDADKS